MVSRQRNSLVVVVVVVVAVVVVVLRVVVLVEVLVPKSKSIEICFKATCGGSRDWTLSTGSHRTTGC